MRAILAQRDRGHRWVLDADIDGFFDGLDRELLQARLRDGVPDAQVLRLLDLWLRAMPFGRAKGKGVALGAVISPLLANVYLQPLDEAMARGRWALVRYADDLVVLCRSRAQAERAQRLVEATLASLLLELNRDKTAIAHFDAGFKFLGVQFRGDRYEYIWRDKRIEVAGDFPGWLYAYGPAYE